MNRSFRTLADVVDARQLSEALEDQRNSENARREEAKADALRSTLRSYPEIGRLNSGKFYAFVGKTRFYFESFKLQDVVDALNEAKLNS